MQGNAEAMHWDQSLTMSRPAKVITRTDRPVSRSKLHIVYKKRGSKNKYKWRRDMRNKKQVLCPLLEEEGRDGGDCAPVPTDIRPTQTTLPLPSVTRRLRVWRWIKSWFTSS